MEKYRFSIDGIPVTVYPISSPEKEREKILSELSMREIACLIYPDSELDFGIECFDKNNNEPREPYSVFAALFCFLACVRSYPRMTVEIVYNGVTREIDLSQKVYNYSVNVGKCKQLLTNKVEFSDKIEIPYHVIETDVPYPVLICHDSDMLADVKLSYILEHERARGARAAFAVSTSDFIRIKAVGTFAPSEAILCSLSVLFSSGYHMAEGEHSIFLCGEEYRVLYSPGRLLFCPNIKYLS